MKVVIIGGVAAGPKTASRIMRLNPEAEVTLIQREGIMSYAGCGLPYHVSGVVEHEKELYSAPTGTIRDAAYFEAVKGFRAITRTEAVEIDRKEKTVHTRNLDTGQEAAYPYDKLLIATGASPVIPPIPGVDLEGVHTLHSVPDAARVRELIYNQGARNVVVVGGGLIGVEAAEAFAEVGCKVTMVEMLPQVMRMLDWDMAKLVEQHMSAKGVTVRTSTKAEAIEGENGKVTGIVCDGQALPADLILMAIGVRPNVALAREAGLSIGPSGAIAVDTHQCTSDADVYAAGDCAEVTHLITKKPMFIPLGSTANKQGRVAAMNICGIPETFPGVMGSTVCKVFDFCVGVTGLTQGAAEEAGYEIVTACAPAPDKAHYYPTAKPILMKLVAEKGTGRFLGLQVAGPGDGSKRIDAAAVALAGGLSVHDLAHVDLCYAPPFSPAMDNLITAANVARNKLSGLMHGISAAEVKDMLDKNEDFLFLDARSPAEYEEVHLPKGKLYPLGKLRQQLSEIPKDKPIVAYCKVSLRGYEAARILAAAGFTDVRVLDGGLAMWPYEKEK